MNLANRVVDLSQLNISGNNLDMSGADSINNSREDDFDN